MSKTIELPDGTPHTFTDEQLERGEAMMARLRKVEASLFEDTGQTTYSEMLLPCPFCGGEAHLVDDYSSEHDHTFYQVWHDCTTSPGAIRHAYGHALSLQISTPWCANEKDAVLLWNRRAERTCRIEVSHGSHGPRPRFPGDAWTMHHVCSECGRPVDGGDRYCKHCGVRFADNHEKE